MTEREKIIEILKQTSDLWKEEESHGYIVSVDLGKIADALIEAGIGDVTEWKERAERMHKEALKQKQLISDSKHSEDTLRNQLKCALDMVSRMEHAKRTLEILYMSGAITEEALRDAVKQAKREIEEENDDDR